MNDGEQVRESEGALFEVEPDLGGVGDRIVSDDERIKLAVRVLRQMRESIGHVISVLEGAEAGGTDALASRLVMARRELAAVVGSAARTIEGVFNGTHLIASDGNAYAIPPNYASKSRLVEGDVLKLTIRADGTFVFKQIAPVERRRLTGRVAIDSSTGDFVVVCGPTSYKVLQASVTFFKAAVGDEAVILVPKGRECVWAAVENIVRR